VTGSALASLCAVSELAHGVPLGIDTPEAALLVVRLGSEVRAYENRCPHRGTSLDWAKGRFMSADGTHFQCATHGALFRLHDGLCVAGPCAGDALVALPVRIALGKAVLGGTP